MQSEYKSLEKIFGIKCKNKELFKKALTHSSFTKENELNSVENYERLEFLGDAVLKLTVSELLYKKFPSYPEGELTKIRSILISDATLAKISTQIGLDNLIILGKHAEKSGARKRPSVAACAFESILGAYYLDNSFNKLFLFLEKVLESYIKDIDGNFEKFNAKAILQEYTQSKNKKTPVYKIIEEIGPEHDKIFVVEVSFMDEILSQGKGKTKREAEQMCAYEACKKLGVIK